MRLWSLHPKYLDSKGLVALWREGLLAKKVLENKTNGYKHHPQLERFKATGQKISYINLYLHYVCDEADQRGYSFDRTKLSRRKKISQKITVPIGQANYEWSHLLQKLQMRYPTGYAKNSQIAKPDLHPLFKRTKGKIASWEAVVQK